MPREKINFVRLMAKSWELAGLFKYLLSDDNRTIVRRKGSICYIHSIFPYCFYDAYAYQGFFPWQPLKKSEASYFFLVVQWCMLTHAHFWRIFNLWRHSFENSELKPVCDFIRLVIENKCFGYELFYSVVMYPDLQIRWGWRVWGGQAVVQTLRPDFSYQAVSSFQEFSFLTLLPQDSQTRNSHSKIYWNDVQKRCRAVFRKHKA